MENLVFSQLNESALDIERQDFQKAKSSLNTLRHELMNTPNDPLSVKGLIFLNALFLGIGDDSETTETNLYLKKFEVPQIELFNLLTYHVPMLKAATYLTNTLLTNILIEQPDPVLLDIGIGTGRQEVELIESWGQSQKLPKKIVIIGIDPSRDSLTIARSNFIALEKKLGIVIDFREICGFVDQLTENDWNFLKEYTGRVVVNESFALHHIPKNKKGSLDSIEPRDEVLSQIYSLKPLLFVLAEPNSDHHSPALAERFKNTWMHFGLTFSVIDQLNISEQQKNVLKVSFFGREITDILNTNDDMRTERHETGKIWTNRLIRSGFSPITNWSSVMNYQIEIIQITRMDSYLSIGYQDQSIVSIIAMNSSS